MERFQILTATRGASALLEPAEVFQVVTWIPAATPAEHRSSITSLQGGSGDMQSEDVTSAGAADAAEQAQGGAGGTRACSILAG